MTEAACCMPDLVVAPATASMRTWRLVRDFPVHLTLYVSGGHPNLVKSITVPKGFTTDFASVPRIFHAIFPPMGRYGVAALVHDYLCDTRLVSRRHADEVFLSLMRNNGVKPWKARVMYAAVRLYAIVTGVDREPDPDHQPTDPSQST